MSVFSSFLDSVIKKVFPSHTVLGKVIDGSLQFSDIFQPHTMLGKVGDVASNLTSSVAGKYAGTNLTGAEQQANEFNAAEAQKDRDWQEMMSNTEVQRRAADYQSAGYNPILAVTNGAAGTPSGASASSVSPGSGSIGDIISLFMAGSQMKNIAAQAKLAESAAAKNYADVKNIEADTALKGSSKEGIDLDNVYKALTFDLRADSVRLQNSLSRQQARKIDYEIDGILSNINLQAKMADTEVAKRDAHEAAAILSRANAYQIAALLPYREALMSAQTEQAKSAAVLASVQALYQQKLVDSDWIDAQIASYYAQARNSGASADLAEQKAVQEAIRSAIRNGEFGIDNTNAVTRTITGAMSQIFGTATVIMDSLNPLSGFLK